MRIKRLFAYGAAGLLMAGMVVTPVSAHGHHSQTDTATKAVCSVCTVEGCTETGYHTHDGQTYCGYDHECGYCDGSCGVVGVCTVEGCTETGQHTHDGQAYCGYNHANGYCDNSCVGQSSGQSAGQGVRQSGGHHSGHHGRHHS